MAFPATLDTFANPSGADTTDNPSASATVGNIGDGVETLQAKVGIDSSAVTTSFDFKLSGVTGSDKAVSLTGTETLTDKILTSPTLTSAVVATSLDMDGQELILDNDADTSITADTDDQIDIEIAGSDDFQFTANTFEALNGSDFLISNDDAYQARQSGGTIKTVIKKNSSNQTEIGENEVRATRFVPITPVQVLSTDPTNTNWVDEDVSAETSGRTFMVSGMVEFASSNVGRQLFLRKNGTALSQGVTTRRARVATTAHSEYFAFVCETDTGQIFEWSVDDADVTNVTISINGYWEYVD